MFIYFAALKYISYNRLCVGYNTEDLNIYSFCIHYNSGTMLAKSAWIGNGLNEQR